MTFGIYPTSLLKELLYLMNDGQASIFIAENQEYVDRILPFFDELPHLRHVVTIDTKGLFKYEHFSLLSYEKVLKIRESQLKSRPRAFQDMAHNVKPSDGLLILYKSVTTALALSWRPCREDRCFRLQNENWGGEPKRY